MARDKIKRMVVALTTGLNILVQTRLLVVAIGYQLSLSLSKGTIKVQFSSINPMTSKNIKGGKGGGTNVQVLF